MVPAAHLKIPLLRFRFIKISHFIFKVFGTEDKCKWILVENIIFIEEKLEMLFKNLIRVGRAIFNARWPAQPFTRDLAVGLFWSFFMKKEAS